jgi:signal transduction histidine kinase
MMPVMDGFEACRRLKNSPATKHIPVLLITALNNTEDKIKGLEVGADDFITKPFNDAELRARVGAFLRTKKLRDELDASYKKLKELEQMRDSLAHMIVHDLKAPLTAITGGLSVLMDHVETDAPISKDLKKLLKNAHNSSKRLVGLIQDILDVSRMEEAELPLTRSLTDMNDLARGCVHLLEPLSGQANVELSFQISSVPVTANVDAALIQRVMSNLISNSIKFTPSGGKVTVGVRDLPSERQVELTVVDTGIGIPKEHLEKIFDKFFQSTGHEASRKGQGLGLAFCRLAVERHGGKIWAESAQGGSRFIVRLPVA